MSYAGRPIGFVRGLLILPVALTAGCTANLIANLIEERVGEISVIFINNTPYRASFTFGTYDPLDRITPGAVNLLQDRVEAKTTTEPAAVPCARAFAIGTDGLIQRATDTNAPLALETFDAAVFTPDINFSSAPANDLAATLPTAGKVEGGFEVLLGVDYGCNDQLIFTFEEDETTPGTFRVKFSLLRTERD